MKVNFKYDRQKDIWCILHKGKSSHNSPNPTKIYKMLVSKYGEGASEKDVDRFIGCYLAENKLSVDEYIKHYATEWKSVADEYQKIAESIFGVTLPYDITVYVNLNNRNPYNIPENSFYVTVPRLSVRKAIMHELWHFYTWYGLGADQEEKLGKQKYNDIKEALTVLLNEECKNLMPEGVCDEGYSQHQKLRDEIVTVWREQKDIHHIWNKFSL